MARGLITDEQARAIAAFEAAGAGKPRRISLFTEALGYVGAVLALAGGSAGLGRAWHELAPLAHMGILAGAAAVTLIGGWSIRRTEEPAFERLLGVTWFLSTGLFAAVVFSFCFEHLAVSGEVAGFAMGVGASVYGGVLWLLHRGMMQQAALLAGLVVTVVAGLTLPPGPDPLWSFTVAVWAIGAIWLALGWRGTLEPANVAVTLGAVVALVGPGIGAGRLGWPFLLALATAGGLLSLGVIGRRIQLLAGASLGMFFYVTWAVIKYFGDTLGVPLALTVAGAIILVLALATARLRRAVASPR